MHIVFIFFMVTKFFCFNLELCHTVSKHLSLMISTAALIWGQILNEKVQVWQFLQWYFSDRPENEDFWPLTSQELDLLKLNRLYLIENITPDAVVSQCYQSNCLNKFHVEAITALGTTSAKVRLLIDIIRNRSIAEYRAFIAALRSAHHGHVADVLESGAGKVERCLSWVLCLILLKV